jgi:cytochrome P450
VARAAGSSFDLIAEFAYALPVAVICELLGVPESGRACFREWSFADVNAPVIGLEAYAEAATAFVEYLHDLIALKRREPADDLTRHPPLPRGAAGPVEAHTAFTSLLARLPGLRLAVPPHEIVAEPGLLMNAFQALLVTARPA